MFFLLEVKLEFSWWINNIMEVNNILFRDVLIVMFIIDVFKLGWGVVLDM